MIGFLIVILAVYIVATIVVVTFSPTVMPNRAAMAEAYGLVLCSQCGTYFYGRPITNRLGYPLQLTSCGQHERQKAA